MTIPCEKCAAGPTGLTGHDDLFTESFVGSDVMLKCRSCGSFWSRATAPAASFAWSSAERSRGNMVP